MSKYLPIPEDEVASAIWRWISDNSTARLKNEYPSPGWNEGTIGYCRSLADYLRLKGFINEPKSAMDLLVEETERLGLYDANHKPSVEPFICAKCKRKGLWMPGILVPPLGTDKSARVCTPCSELKKE